MPVQGTLTGEAVPFKSVDSINSLFRGQVRLVNGTLKSCLIKDIGRVELINELISNFVAEKLGLPVPEAVLIYIPKKVNKNGDFSKAMKFDGGKLAFGSVDVQTPNLTQRFETAHFLEINIIKQALINWEQRGHLYGFDTWVANTDRHSGNLLFGSKNEIWLIDHGRCFTKEDWKPLDLEPDQTYLNKLQIWYTPMMDNAIRLQTKLSLTKVQSEIAKLSVKDVMEGSFADGLANHNERKALSKFLTERIGRVTADGAVALKP